MTRITKLPSSDRAEDFFNFRLELRELLEKHHVDVHCRTSSKILSGFFFDNLIAYFVAINQREPQGGVYEKVAKKNHTS